MELLKDITTHTSNLESMSLILMILSIAFFIAAAVFWFAFKIPHSIKVLTRLGTSKKNTDKLYQVPDGVRASLSWNTSARLDRKNDIAFNNDSDETQLLSDETIVLTPEELGFEIEEDIVITGNQQELE